MKLVKQVLAVAILASLVPLTAHANEDRSNGGAITTGAVANGQSRTTGVVKKVDLEQSKITISHGPIANLGMPAMTMVFRVADSSLLTSVKSDDKINFVADKVNGAFTVVSWERMN